jgi:peptidyl-prolyl cis-trans isomerase C
MPFRTLRAAAVALTVSLSVAPALAAESADPVVATVNGQDVKQSDVVALQQTIPQLRQVPTEMVFDQLLDHLISTRLIVAEARKQNLQNDPEVKARLQEVENQVLQQVYLKKAVEPQLTEAALKKRYEETIKNAPAKEEVHARHILLPSEDEAKAVIAELDKGKSFEDVAKEKSKGPSANTGGDLGYFTKDEMVPEFADAAFKLKPGEYTKAPVKTQFGWHVIKVEDKRTAPPAKFEDVKDEMKEQIAEELASKMVEQLRAKAEIKKTAAAPAKPAPAAAPAPEKK